MAVFCYALNSLVIMKKSGDEVEKSGGCGGGRSKTPPTMRRQVPPEVVRGSERHSSYCPLPLCGGDSGCATAAFLFPPAEQSPAREEALARRTPRRLSSPSWVSPPSRSPSPGWEEVRRTSRIFQRELQNVQVTEKVGLFEAHIQAQSSGASTRLPRKRSPSPNRPRVTQLLEDTQSGQREKEEEEIKELEGLLSRLETTVKALEQEAEKGFEETRLLRPAGKGKAGRDSPTVQDGMGRENGLSGVQRPKAMELADRDSGARDSKAVKSRSQTQVWGSDKTDALLTAPGSDGMGRANGISRAHESRKGESLCSLERQGLEERSGSLAEKDSREKEGPRGCEGSQGSDVRMQSCMADVRLSGGPRKVSGCGENAGLLEIGRGRRGFPRGQGSGAIEKPLREPLPPADPPCLARTDGKESSSSLIALTFSEEKHPPVSQPCFDLMDEAGVVGLPVQHPGEQQPPAGISAAVPQPSKSLVEGESCCGGGTIPAVIVTDLDAQEEEKAGGTPPKDMVIRKLSSSSASSTGFSSWEESEEDISSDSERSLDQSPAFLQTLDKPRVHLPEIQSAVEQFPSSDPYSDDQPECVKAQV